jgi:hypothetical protein
VLTIARLIPIQFHAAIEVAVGPILMFAPFVLGFSPGALIASFLLGVLVTAVALSTITATTGPRSEVRMSSHAEVDLGISVATAACAIGFGLLGEAAAAGFFGLTAIALSLLGMTTRYGTLRA